MGSYIGSPSTSKKKKEKKRRDQDEREREQIFIAYLPKLRFDCFVEKTQHFVGSFACSFVSP